MHRSRASAGTGAVEHDRRRHARQHPLARRDRVRARPVDQAHRIHRSDLRREVVHLVVQQEARARHGHRRAVALVERRRDRYGVAVCRPRREVRRVTLAARRAPPARCRTAGQISLSSAAAVSETKSFTGIFIKAGSPSWLFAARTPRARRRRRVDRLPATRQPIGASRTAQNARDQRERQPAARRGRHRDT